MNFKASKNICYMCNVLSEIREENKNEDIVDSEKQMLAMKNKNVDSEKQECRQWKTRM